MDRFALEQVERALGSEANRIRRGAVRSAAVGAHA